jgi:hypothetical protein
MFLIITWTERLPGDVASRGCITPAEASTLFQEISGQAKWIGTHGDLHHKNVHFWRCTGDCQEPCQEPCQGVCQGACKGVYQTSSQRQGQGKPVLRVFDLGLPFIDSNNEGYVREFDEETSQYVSFCLCIFLIVPQTVFLFFQLMAAPRGDIMGLAVLIFNFMAGMPLQQVPGYAESVRQKPAQRPAMTLEEAARQREQELLGCPQGDDFAEDQAAEQMAEQAAEQIAEQMAELPKLSLRSDFLLGKRGRVCSPSKPEEPAPPAFVIRPKKLMF